MNDFLPIFIGYDSRETLPFHVLSNSIRRHSSIPVTITPVALDNLKGVFTRERDPLQSTDFAFSRFLTPWLATNMGFKNWAVFMDCDMLFRGDIAQLLDEIRRSPFATIHCVKHDYTPKTKTKFLNQVQTPYPCKNWSSFMVFNLKSYSVRHLTPDYVNHASGLELHQFKWLIKRDQINGLDPKWNHLVGEYDYDPDAQNVHFTLGGPYFEEYKDCDYANEWRQELGKTFHCEQTDKTPTHRIGGNGEDKDRMAVFT